VRGPGLVLKSVRVEVACVERGVHQQIVIEDDGGDVEPFFSGDLFDFRPNNLGAATRDSDLDLLIGCDG
jgi:hypothetical protein